ncbi:MAG: hypothetical protein KGI27_12220 [Thaumarchaeota archaeon]|nr:hypothetical protein [Nitrososphaerota archaeon]
MKFEISARQIRLDKELNDLDYIVIDFTKTLNTKRVDYALVSGYVSILFGRSRSSEDIDLIAKKISMKKFFILWEELSNDFKCITTGNAKNAYDNYLVKHHAVRFSRKGTFIPNMELKFPKMDLDNWAIENAKNVILNGNDAIKISPIELQIPYKLFLGSEKDIEDAKYLYKLFDGKLDKTMFKYFLKNLDKEDKFNKYLR